jgi:hypothetical protein
MLHKATVKTYTASAAKPNLGVIDPTASHFGTAGRILAWFPQVNANGFATLSEDVPDSMISTLVGSTVDLEHVKKGFGQTSMLVPKENNTVCGSIVEAARTDEGIDISTKLERSLISAFGFTPADFEPGIGVLSAFSQEMDFLPSEGSYIVVDKSDPSKILEKIPYADGLAAGLPDVADGVGPSRMVAGTWQYTFKDGNPVYFAAKPSSFVGVGHVAKPADPTALTYRMVANERGEKKLVGFYPGLDDGPAAPAEMTGMGDVNSTDLNVWGSDCLSNPDILTASADNFPHEDEAADKKNKDGDFAVNYSCLDYGSVTNGRPNIDKKRLFKIKNDKGELDRNRLISAYRALMGTRGDIHLVSSLPSAVRNHALALVRQGLKSTKPKITKENSSMKDPEIEALDAKIAELAAQRKLISSADHQVVVDAKAEAEAKVATLTASISEKDTAIADLTEKLATATAKIAEFEATALAAERLAALEAIHPFSEDEKKAETFGDFTKSLASLTVDGLENAKLKRTIAAMQAKAEATPARVLANVRPTVNPVPATGATMVNGEEPLSVGLLY